MRKAFSSIIILLFGCVCSAFQSSSSGPTTNNITPIITLTPTAILSPTTTLSPTATLSPADISASVSPTCVASSYTEEEIKEAQAIINELMPLYSETLELFETGLGRGKLGDEIWDENGNAYLPVNSDKYKSVEDIWAVGQAVYTENYLDNRYYWVLGGDYPKYKEINGKLCAAMADGMPLPLQPDIISIQEMGDTEIILKMQALNNEGLMDVDVTLKKVDGNWLIDDILYKFTD